MTLSASQASEKMEIKIEPLSDDENHHTETLPGSENVPVMRLMPRLDFSKKSLKEVLCHKSSDDNLLEEDSEKVPSEQDLKNQVPHVQESEDSDESDDRPTKGKVRKFGKSTGKVKCFSNLENSDTNNFRQTKTLDDYNKFLSVAWARKEASFLEVLLSKNTPEEVSMKQRSQSMESGHIPSENVSSNVTTLASQDQQPLENNDMFTIKTEPLSDEEQPYEEPMDISQPSMILPYMDYSEVNFEESSGEDVDVAKYDEDDDDEEWKASGAETEESVEEEKSPDSDFEESDDGDDSDSKDKKSYFKRKCLSPRAKKSKGKLFRKSSNPIKPAYLQTKTKIGDSIEEYNQLLSIAHGSKDVSYLQFLLSKNTRNEIKDLAKKRNESKYLKNKNKREEKSEVIDTLRKRNLLPSTIGSDLPYPVLDSCAKLLQLDNDQTTSKNKSSCQASKSDQIPICGSKQKRDNNDLSSEPKMLDGLNSRSCLLLQHLLVKEQKQPTNVSQPSTSSPVPGNSYGDVDDKSVLRSMLTGTTPIPTSVSTQRVPNVKATLLKDLLVANPAPLTNYSEEFLLAKSDRTQNSSPDSMEPSVKPQRLSVKSEELSPEESIEGYMVYVNRSNDDNPIEDEENDTLTSTASDPSEERVSYTPAASCSDGDDNNPDEPLPNVTIKSEPLSPSTNLDEKNDSQVGNDTEADDQVVVKQEPVDQDDRPDDQDAIKKSYEEEMVQIKSEPSTSFEMEEKRSLNPESRHTTRGDSSLRNILENRNYPHQAFQSANFSSTTSQRTPIVEPVSAAAQLMSLSKASSNKQETILKGLINGSSTSILGLDSSQEHTYNTRHKRKFEGTSLLEKALKTLKPNFPARINMSSPTVRESPERILPQGQPGYYSSKLSEAVLMSSSKASDFKRTIPPMPSCSQQLLNIIKNVGASQQKTETKPLTLLKTMLNDKGSGQSSKSDQNTGNVSIQYQIGQKTNISSHNEISPRSMAFTTIPSQSQGRMSSINVVKSHTITRESSPGNTEYPSGHSMESSSPSQVHMVTKCPYQCRICGNAFRSTSLLEEHMQVHFGAMPFGCTLCHKSYMTGHELEEHMSVHANELSPAVVYKCTVCGIVFDTAEEHNKHRINHELNKPVLFNCITCNKCFATREILEGHMQTHHTPAKELNAEKYTGSCNHCNKEFKKHSKFVRHMTLHSALKDYKYKCEKCEKGFVTKTGMAGHIAKCQGPAYACSGCGKSFIRKIELCAHFQDEHQVSGTRCECCYKMFCFSYQKEEHLKEHEHDPWTVISKRRKDPKSSGVFAPLETKDMMFSVHKSNEPSVECMTDPEDDIEIVSDSE